MDKDDTLTREAAQTAAEASARYVAAPYTFEVLEDVSHWIPEMAPQQLSRLLIAHLAAH